jgi:SET domain-containing protein
LPPREVLLMKGSTLSHFWFEDDEDGAAFVVLGFIELVNHSTTPNADRSWRATPEGEVVTLYALSDIEPGEQVFIDYKFDACSAKPDWA